MRDSDEWMVLADDRILEFLHEEKPAGPTEISRHPRMHFGDEYIGRRLRDHLEPKSYVEHLGNGIYRITEKGAAYLAGASEGTNG